MENIMLQQFAVFVSTVKPFIELGVEPSTGPKLISFLLPANPDKTNLNNAFGTLKKVVEDFDKLMTKYKDFIEAKNRSEDIKRFEDEISKIFENIYSHIIQCVITLSKLDPSIQAGRSITVGSILDTISTALCKYQRDQITYLLEKERTSADITMQLAQKTEEVSQLKVAVKKNEDLQAIVTEKTNSVNELSKKVEELHVSLLQTTQAKNSLETNIATKDGEIQTLRLEFTQKRTELERLQGNGDAQMEHSSIAHNCRRLLQIIEPYIIPTEFRLAGATLEQLSPSIVQVLMESKNPEKVIAILHPIFPSAINTRKRITAPSPVQQVEEVSATPGYRVDLPDEEKSTPKMRENTGNDTSPPLKIRRTDERLRLWCASCDDHMHDPWKGKKFATIEEAENYLANSEHAKHTGGQVIPTSP